MGRHSVGERSVGYRFLFETGVFGILLATDDGIVLDANREASRLSAREGLVGSRLDEVFDDSDPRFAPAMRERRETGDFNGRLRLLREDGSSLPVEASLESYGYRGEERVGVILREFAGREARLNEAIVELERSRHRLAVSEQLFRVTFDQAAVGMAHVASDGKWLRVNDKLCEIVGYRRDELLALTFQDITHPDDLDKDLEHTRRMLEGEIRAYRMDKRYFRKDGTRIWIDLSVSLIRRPTDEPECFVAAIEDITQRKLKELVPDPLTSREMEALRLVARWKTNSEIAWKLGYSEGTIKQDVRSIIAKLEVENRRQAAARAVEVGLISPPR